MTKDVELIIKGYQKYDTHEDNDLETKTSAEYFFRNQSHFVLYEEQAEGFRQSTKSMLKIKEGCLEMTRKGLVNTTMVFDRARVTMTHYRTPFGEFVLEIETKSLTLQEKEDLIRAEVTYSLRAEDRHMADCRICIQIRAK